MIVKFNSKKTRMLKLINFVLGMFFYTKKNGLPLDFEKIKEILIIDPNMIGDMVMLEPFLRIIKNNIPDCHITLVCSKWAQDVFENEKLVDKYVLVTKAAFTNQWTNKEYKEILNNALKEINTITYDLALEPRGDIRYIYFMSKCTAKRKISYNYTGGECFLTDVIVPGEKIEHLVDDKLYFLEQLKFKFCDCDRYPILHLSSDDIQNNQKFLLDNKIEKRYVIGIHPGASLKIKQWGYYPELAKKIIDTYNNCAIILFEGPGEKTIVDEVENEIAGCNVPIVRSKTNISTYMRLLALCGLVICNDSGAGHIAAAYGDKVITIFGPVLPSLAKPYGKNVIAISDDSLECKPCVSSECYKNCECINSIGVDEVMERVYMCIERENS